MAEKKKKKKRSSAQMHRQVQDSLQALPYVIQHHEKEGKRFKAMVVRYLTAPMLKLMDKALSRTRYRGPEGEKQKQTDQMRRRLEQRKQAMQHVQSHMQKQQRRGRPM